MNTRSLTGNRDRDKGWAQTPEGNWTPSVHDRRRVAVAELNLVAEVNRVPALPFPVVAEVLSKHAMEDEADIRALLENFGKWMKGS